MWMLSPPRWPAETLILDLQKSNQVIRKGYWLFPVSFIEITQAIHEILW